MSQILYQDRIFWAYILIQIGLDNKQKKVFQARFSYFYYKIILFRLTNAPAKFQTYIKTVIPEYLDIFVLKYLENILVFLKKSQRKY